MSTVKKIYIFLNLENSRKKKSCIRKLNTEKDKGTTKPKEILNEIQLFYANLYDKKKNLVLLNELIEVELPP